jgi:hypothetical protein
MKTGAQRMPDEPPLDAVSDADGLNDARWFAAAENTGRQFRGRVDAAGRVWVIRSMPRNSENIYLRVRTAATALPRHDADPGLAFLYFSAAWPDLTGKEVRALARRALRGRVR